jgi:hypothetical protein
MNMHKPFDASYEDIGNILMEYQEEDRISHVQHEMQQMLVSFLTLFKAHSLQVEAHTYTLKGAAKCCISH